MLSCPRCGTGYFKKGQSPTMNLTQYCQGLSLLCHAQRKILPTKCSHDQMLSGSCPTTFQQNIRNFNSLREKCICSYNEYITWHAISNTFIISTIWIGKLKCALLWVLNWPIHTSICWWSINHQWQYNYGPCHSKILFLEKYHVFTPWYCISSSSVVTNEWTQRQWSSHVQPSH